MRSIKLSVLPFLLLLSSVALFAQQEVLFSVDGNDVTKEEFLYIYSKSNKEVSFDKASVDEYLELYKNFKLKVHEGKEESYDESKMYQQELKVYRDQLAKSYIVDKVLLNDLTKEAYDRYQEDVAFSHLLFTIDKRNRPEDTLAAFQKATRIKALLDSEKKLESMMKYSDDGVSYIGYISALQYPNIYSLETALYNAKKGDIVGPIRTGLGYHIVRLDDRRPAFGEVEVGQILIRTKANKVTSEEAKARIDSIYKSLALGQSFESLAADYSEDKKSNFKGGNLGVIKVGQKAHAFEKQVYNLKTDGAYSKPFQSKAGWHIVKRLSKQAPRSYALRKRQLSNAVKRDSRFVMRQQEFVEKIKEEEKFTEDLALIQRFSANQTPAIFSSKWDAKITEKDAGVVVFSIRDEKYTLQDFKAHLKSSRTERYRAKGKLTPARLVMDLYNKEVNAQVLKFEESKLEEKYPDFKNLVREYEEGILLFNVSKDKVWDKASSDSIGLANFFEAHKEDYKWEIRAEVEEYVIQSADSTVFLKAKKYITKKSKDKVLAKFNKESEVIIAQSAKYEEVKFKEKYVNLGFFGGDMMTEYVDDNTYKIYKVLQLLPEEHKELHECRGYVISDYQTVLDQKWISALRSKYEVTLNEDVLQSIYK